MKSSNRSPFLPSNTSSLASLCWPGDPGQAGGLVSCAALSVFLWCSLQVLGQGRFSLQSHVQWSAPYFTLIPWFLVGPAVVPLWLRVYHLSNVISVCCSVWRGVMSICYVGWLSSRSGLARSDWRRGMSHLLDFGSCSVHMTSFPIC